MICFSVSVLKQQTLQKKKKKGKREKQREKQKERKKEKKRLRFDALNPVLSQFTEVDGFT